MIEILKQPGEYCFVGNPVVFEMKSDNQDPIEVVITYDGKEISLTPYPFKADQGYLVSVDISDVLKSFFNNGLPMYGETVEIAEYPEFIRECTVAIAGKKFTLKAIDGGVSDANLTELLESDDDMFSYRLTNPERSLLFTTRTNGSNLVLRESELFPFVFIHPGKKMSFVSEKGNVIDTEEIAKGTPCLMDLSYVRREFLEQYNELTSQIAIKVDEIDSSYVTITPSAWSENLHWIVFKNSLGGYECVEITGKGYHAPTLSEENSYQQHISQGTFTLKRERVQLQGVVSIQSGYKNQDELDFLMDLITTNRAYLIYPDKRVAECIPSAENPKYALRITEPTSIDLKLKMVNVDKYHSPKLSLSSPDAWILDTGFWDDHAVWKDNKKWID